MNLLEQLYKLNEQDYRVVELDRNKHYELMLLDDIDSKCVDNYKGDIERAIMTFYEKYVRMQNIPKICDCCGGKMSLRNSDFTSPYWYCGNCNGN